MIKRSRPFSKIAAAVATLAAGALIAGASMPATGLAAVVDCDQYAYYPNVLISSARSMSCGAGARDMRRYKRPIYRTFTTPGGFRCTRVSGGAYGGQWRCVNGARAYRFDFGD